MSNNYIWILRFHSKPGNWDYGIASHFKFALPNYTPFEIGITGLQDPPPFQGPIVLTPIMGFKGRTQNCDKGCVELLSNVLDVEKLRCRYFSAKPKCKPRAPLP